ARYLGDHAARGHCSHPGRCGDHRRRRAVAPGLARRILRGVDRHLAGHRRVAGLASARTVTDLHHTRFAPAPTGYLHLGHLVNAIFVWGLAARLGADVLLRIEDHDRQRSRPDFEQQLLDELDWLGFAPDRFPTSAFRAGVCASRQSDRHQVYADAAARLAADGL